MADLKDSSKPSPFAGAQSLSVDRDISLTHDCDFDGKFNLVSAIIVLNDDNLLVADRFFLKLYNKQGKFIKELKVDGKSWDEEAWDLSCHKTSGRVVVSLKNNGIQFLDDFILQPKIPIPSLTLCYGITYMNDKIAVGGKGKISVRGYDGGEITTISTENTSYIHFIRYHQGKLYFTDNSNKVYCVKEDGQNLQTITISGLGGAEGVITDNKGNIYVAGYQTDNIVCLSSDGRNQKEILKNERRPVALCFSKDYRKLFISSGYKPVANAVKSFTVR